MKQSHGDHTAAELPRLSALFYTLSFVIIALYDVRHVGGGGTKPALNQDCSRAHNRSCSPPSTRA